MSFEVDVLSLKVFDIGFLLLAKVIRKCPVGVRHLLNSFIRIGVIISNIVHNLIDNAIKYCEKSPKITIKTTSTSSTITFTITDNGIGIKKENLKLIFDKFYRVPTGDIHNVKGFGLGLYYVKLITDSHDGKLQVKSIFGNGTTFLITLPLHKKK